MKNLIGICILLIFAVNAFAQQPKKDSVEKPMALVCGFEKSPEFIGGQKALMEFLNKNIQYPYEAQEKGIQGKVFVTFRVRQDGSIDSIKIAKDVHSSLNNEAIRLIKLMPKWNAGTMNGKSVNAYYTLPINFVLKDEKTTKK